MGTWIAILRGINVSGARKLPMKELKELFETLKCTNVRTYIQSGNVVFESAKLDVSTFGKKVEAAIKKRYEYDVPVLIRSLEDMKKVVAANPYLKRKGIEPDKLHVTFLANAPKKPEAERMIGTTSGNDSFELIGREAYVHCPDGYGNTKLNNAFFESKLKVSATTRNWRTVNELVRMGEAG
jgi:uncharacterized protein (DUF1697 family)